MENPAAKIEVRPLEAKRLPLAEPEGKSDCPSSAIPPLPCLSKDRLDLLHRVGLDLFLLLDIGSRRLRLGCRIALDMTSCLSDTERSSDRSVNLMCGTWSRAGQHAIGSVHVPGPLNRRRHALTAATLAKILRLAQPLSALMPKWVRFGFDVAGGDYWGTIDSGARGVVMGSA